MNPFESGQNHPGVEPRLHAIIPAGGAGTRLWPLSRAGQPKFLLDLVGDGHSLLASTILRLAPISASITVVTGQAHASAVRDQIQDLNRRNLLDPNLDVRVMAEPSPRDSMPAIGLAAAWIRQHYGEDAIVGSFAADHAIGGADAFRDVISQAIEAAQLGFLTTIGVLPASASTAFGYIQPEEKFVSPGARLVRRFVEKPPSRIAEEYVAAGYLWNAGMFVVGAGTMLSHLRELHPKMESALGELAQLWGQDTTAPKIDELWNRLPRIAIDHALAEPVAAAGGVAVVETPSSVQWSDVGDFASLADVLVDDPAEGRPKSAEQQASTRGRDPLAVRLESPGAVIFDQVGKVIAVVGVPGAVVVETPDALLVTRLERNQQVKEVVETLRALDRDDVL